MLSWIGLHIEEGESDSAIVFGGFLFCFRFYTFYEVIYFFYYGLSPVFFHRYQLYIAFYYSYVNSL